MLNFFPKAASNQFGNYLCQRVIEACSPADLKTLVFAMVPSLTEMALNQHGTRVVQVLIEVLAAEWQKSGQLANELMAIIGEFKKEALMLCSHINGNHVI